MTLDGHRLRETWSAALDDAVANFRTHLTSAQSPSWKRVPLGDVAVHRKATGRGDVHRVALDVPVPTGAGDLDAWRAVLGTPELRAEWDPAVEAARVLEMHDPATRIVQTRFTLGWPASPRDAVMISRTFCDATTLIDVSTSLPRSPDEPAYLRPAPPYVRSHVDLFAWCIQVVAPETRSKRIRITCFWQHDLKTVWNIGTPNSIPQQLATMALGLLDTVKNRQARTPVLAAYGFGVAIERVAFDVGRDALSVDYAVVPEEQDSTPVMHGLDELHALKEQRRLQRSVEILLPSPDGWDIRLATRASAEAVAQLPWTASASRCGGGGAKVCFQVRHAPLPDAHAVLRVQLVLEFSGVLRGVRLNGLAHALEDRVQRDLQASAVAGQLLQDAASAADVSLNTAGASAATAESEASAGSAASLRKPALLRTDSGASVVPRGPAFDKSILARVRRNYIYFSSLLQEPEAKWKQNTEVRGVSVTQLDSIDPTLVVYKAEATFVGIGLWDLYSAVVTPGARAHWDRQYDDATLLEDVNELSELWHYKTKPAWPVVGRDAVVLKTVYKAPAAVHVFGFSMEDAHLFPAIEPAELGTIRTQVDLQGWAIEALSPTTTQLTLLEQSDPKGWTGKATVPQQMIAAVAGIGEFAIRCGGPPVVSRLGGARATSQRYDHERGVFRVEYEPAASRRAAPADAPGAAHARQNSVDGAQTQGMITPQRSENATSASVECELRCDIDTWATSLDIVIDPPPQSISCLRRHRLSAGGGGLWLTVGHDIAFNSDERLLAIVRRAPFTAGKEKGVVMVNGKRVGIDVEELPEAEVKSLVKQKRVRPVRIPLDQPPVLGVIRRRRGEREDGNDSSDSGAEAGASSSHRRWQSAQAAPAYPKVPSPLSNFFTAAMEQVTSTTQQAVAVFSPPVAPKRPMHYALDALAFAQGYHRGTDLTIRRRLSPEISPARVIEGVAAEEVAAAIWDDRFGSATVFEEYGGDCHTADRGMYLASLVAREDKLAAADGSALGTGGAQSPSGVPSTIYCVSASFSPAAATAFAPAKYNPYALPVGHTFVDAWVVETLDPYTAENYAIPSTRCTRLVAVDHAGAVPVAFNSMINAALPRAVLALEAYMRGVAPAPAVRVPAAGFRLARDAWDVAEGAWALRRESEETTLLGSRLALGSRVFCADVLVALDGAPAESESPNSEDGETERSRSQTTPRPGRAGLPSRPSSPEVVRRPREDGTPSSSPSRRHRRISSTPAATPAGSLAVRSRSREAMRSATSAFSIGRDNRGHAVPADFVVAELVVDLRTYPEGYEVRLASRIEARADPQQPVLLSRLGADVRSAPDAGAVLPIAHSVCVLPPSPLHIPSAGVETPVRHLVRLTLPTAQYGVPAVEDPLTGETRGAPPKPPWLRDLERDKHALVRVEVQPLDAEKQKKGKKVVLVDGLAAVVGSEKDVFKGAAGDEASAGLLSRIHLQEGGDTLVLPKQLASPLAVEDSLYEPITAETGAQGSSTSLKQDEPSDNDAKDDESIRADFSETPAEEKPEMLPADANRGFFGFLGSYQPSLSLLRIGSGSSTPSLSTPKAPGSFPSPAPTPPPENDGTPPLATAAVSTPSSLNANGATASALAVVRSATTQRYSVSTLIAAVLIAFLLGSLLRSLLSPADFIYVVTDLGDVPYGVTRAPGGGLGAVEPGWREIKRLVEMKYIVGGWDFQIAVVRRH
ncbi:hypothetical protein DFH11DRAFT_1800762 [Phellopilus nigrolimitatus]|nr:hypothetical protein DFH11DRAFT_1800762 [Phellopilus nigrolimitatus]